MKLLQLYLSIILLSALLSCKKYLDAKSDQSLSTPSTLADLQAILDNYGTLNSNATSYNNNQTDEYYFLYSDWQALSPQPLQDSYIWAPQIYLETGQGTDDWSYQYQIVFYANTVLDNLEKISPTGQEAKWNSIKGAALFYRAFAYFELTQLYALQYDSSTANNDLGIVIRLTSDFNKPSSRATLQQTYDQIFSDLNQAYLLLPSNIIPNSPENKTRPNRITVSAMLARAYLQVGNYKKARENADYCLSQYGVLIDFNSGTNPFKRLNDETIFYSITANTLNAAYYFGAKVDSTIYMSFESSDLRKTMYFIDNGDGTYTWKGNYSANRFTLFSGIATDEVYLIRAEANARLGNAIEAANDLNTLLEKRYVYGSFVQLNFANSDDALVRVLLERKKELLNRGRRWSDLKRLNKEPKFAVTLKRILNGQTYTLPPNDLRYAFLIPRKVIELTGMNQNSR